MLAFCIAGCSFIGDREEIQTEIRTDRDSYAMHNHTGDGPPAAERVRVSITNASSAPIFYPLWSPWVTLEKQVDGEWENLGTWLYSYGIYRIVEIGAEEQLEAAALSLEERIVAAPGVYRFVFVLFSGTRAPQLLPQEQRTSNPFVVVE